MNEAELKKLRITANRQKHSQVRLGKKKLGCLGKLNDIACVIAMLVSDDAGWITEQNIRAIDGIV